MPFDRDTGNYARFPVSVNPRRGYSNDALSENQAVETLLNDYGNPFKNGRRTREVERVTMHGRRKSLEPDIVPDTHFMEHRYTGGAKPALIIEFHGKDDYYESVPLAFGVRIRVHKRGKIWHADCPNSYFAEFGKASSPNLFWAIKKLVAQKRWFYYQPGNQWAGLDWVYRSVFFDFKDGSGNLPSGKVVRVLDAGHIKAGYWCFNIGKHNQPEPLPEYWGLNSRVTGKLEEPEKLPAKPVPFGFHFQNGSMVSGFVPRSFASKEAALDYLRSMR